MGHGTFVKRVRVSMRVRVKVSVSVRMIVSEGGDGECERVSERSSACGVSE